MLIGKSLKRVVQLLRKLRCRNRNIAECLAGHLFQSGLRGLPHLIEQLILASQVGEKLILACQLALERIRPCAERIGAGPRVEQLLIQRFLLRCKVSIQRLEVAGGRPRKRTR